MDISSARLAALLKEATTPQAVPLAKADPVRMALVKALVQPPAPSLLAKQTAPALLAMPAAPMAVKSQQIASAGIVEAYRAQLESSEEAAPATVVARNAAPDAESRRDTVPPLARADDTVSARPAAVSLLSLVPPQHPTPRRASSVHDASAGRGRPTTQPQSATPLNHERLLLKIGFVSTTAALLAAAAFGLVIRILS
jgi:hypothetical protein